MDLPAEVVPVAGLLLDLRNPRHRDVDNQREAIQVLLGRRPERILTLADHIALHGMNPLDNILLLRKGPQRVVLEGNRRIAALKLLNNPDLAPTTKIRERLELMRVGRDIPDEIRCLVVDSREAGAEWLRLRHGGELDGAGTVRWSAGQRVRFGAKPGSQEYKAVAVLDWVMSKADRGSNIDLSDLTDRIFDNKLTTFGRLISDPIFREFCGFELSDRAVVFLNGESSVLQALTQVLLDLDNNLTVTDLKKKEQRSAYVQRLASELGWSSPVREEGNESDTESDEDDPEGDDASPKNGSAWRDSGASNTAASSTGRERTASSTGETTSSSGQAPASSRPQSQPPPSKRLFAGLKLRHCGPRTRQILREAQQLDVEGFPNAAAALTRMVVEFVVMDAMGALILTLPQGKDELRFKVGVCLAHLDPSNKDRRYKDLRTQVNQHDSLISANTLNAFLHNPHYSPVASELRAISDKYAVLLQDLDAVMGQS